MKELREIFQNTEEFELVWHVLGFFLCAVEYHHKPDIGVPMSSIESAFGVYAKKAKDIILRLIEEDYFSFNKDFFNKKRVCLSDSYIQFRKQIYSEK